MPNHAAVITALILERPMCLACIATKSGLGESQLDEVLAIVRSALRLHSNVERCRACGNSTAVVFLDRPE